MGTREGRTRNKTRDSREYSNVLEIICFFVLYNGEIRELVQEPNIEDRKATTQLEQVREKRQCCVEAIHA